MIVMTDSRLRDLIQRSLEARDWTLADLHRETRRLDPERRGVAYSSLAAWMNPPPGQHGLPRTRNLDLVARALGLDADVVRAAAGYRVEDAEPADPELEVFAADYSKMSPAQRQRLMRIVRGIMDDPDLFPKRRGDGNGG